MNNLHKRYLLFLLGCIPTRLGFALLAKYIPNKYLPYLGILALIPAAGFLYIYFFNKRKTGQEVFGSKIWWNPLRIRNNISPNDYTTATNVWRTIHNPITKQV